MSVKEWLEKLHGKSPGYFSVTVFVNGKLKAVAAYDKDTIDQATAAIENVNVGDIYVSCATYKISPTRDHRGSGNDTVSIPGFWCEIDIDGPGHKPDVNKLPLPKTIDEALSILDRLPEPTAIVHSGGGLHCWWFFDEPWIFSDPVAAKAAVDDWQRLINDRAESKGFSVDDVGDLGRILRPPGTFNRKLKEEAREVKLFRQTDTQYPIVELASMGIPPAPRTHSEIMDESGLGSWAEILEPHGWTLVKKGEDGYAEWHRPGKNDGPISATTGKYGVPVLVNFSSNSGLPVGPGQRLTKFKVWAHLNYNGDLAAAKVVLDKRQVTNDDVLIQRAEKYDFTLIDWPEFWKEEEEEINWLAEPIIEQGRQIAIFSEAKQGKSLLMIEVCAFLATGRAPFTELEREPIDILYFDKENMKTDIRERLIDMGFGEETNLSRLHYSWFPNMPYFDTAEGGLDLLALAVRTNAKLVIIDTLSRVTEGAENDNDTYNNFYKHTGVYLKERGITLVRLDHSGKDSSKGMRGASSKTTDVDDVWELKADSDKGPVRLNRTHTRANHGVSRIVFGRFYEPFRHLPIDSSIVQVNTAGPVEECMVAMDLAGIPDKMAQNKAWDIFKDKPECAWDQKIVKQAQGRRNEVSSGTK